MISILMGAEFLERNQPYICVCLLIGGQCGMKERMM